MRIILLLILSAWTSYGAVSAVIGPGLQGGGTIGPGFNASVGVSGSITAKVGQFDGTDDRLTFALTPAGMVHSQKFIFNYWVKPTDDDGGNRFFLNHSTSFYIYLNTANKLELYALGTNAVQALYVTGDSTVTADGNFHHFLVEWDMTANGRCFAFVDGTQQTFTTNGGAAGFVLDMNLDLAGNVWSIMSDSSAFAGGTGSEFYFAPNQWINDITKFRVGGHPVSLGATGQLPTGVAPVWYLSLSGDGDSWANDSSGNGHNMTVAGGGLGSGGGRP